MKSFKLISPTLVLLIICIIVAGLLSYTNMITKGPIEKIAQNTSENLRTQVLPSAKSFEEKEDYFIGLDEKNNIVGYVFSKASKGYGGDVSVMIGISVKDEVTGVAILEHGETPGLGANCVKSSFTDEYNQKITDKGFVVVKDGSGGKDGNVDAITGATITSRAVTNSVNLAIEQYMSITSGK